MSVEGLRWKSIEYYLKRGNTPDIVIEGSEFPWWVAFDVSIITLISTKSTFIENVDSSEFKKLCSSLSYL